MGARGRFLAAALVPVFAISFALTVFALRVEGSLLEPDFYTDAMERLEVYELFYDELLPLVLARRGLDVSRAPESLGLSAEGLAAKMKRVVPPEELERQVRDAVTSLLPYLAGDAESFELVVRPGAWVEPAADVVRELSREPELYGYLLDEVVREPVEPAWNDFRESLPFRLELTLDEVFEDLQIILPAPCVAERLDAFLDGFVPYLLGRTESFAAHFELEERAVAAFDVLRGWLHQALEGDGYEYLVARQGAPRLRNALAANVRFPYGVRFSDSELRNVVALALPREWVGAELDRAVDAVRDYLTGASATLALSIPLGERADAAALVLATAANVEARRLYDELPECTEAEEASLGASPGFLPECRVPGLDYDGVRARAGFDLRERIRDALAESFPESLDVTEEDLRAAFEGSGEDRDLDAVRSVLAEGYTFDEEELRRLLEARAAETTETGQATPLERFRTLRERLRDGIRITEADLRRDADPGRLAALDRARRWLGASGAFLWALVIVELLLAAGIAVLGGGRSTASRAMWGGVTVSLGGALLLLWTFAASAGLENVVTPSLQRLQLGEAATARLLELRDGFVAAFAGPLYVQGTVVGVVGAGLVVWGLRRARLGTETAPPPS